MQEGQSHCLHGRFHAVLNLNHLIGHQNHQHQLYCSASLFGQLFANDKRPINSWKASNLFRLTWRLLVSIPSTGEWFQCFFVFMSLLCAESQPVSMLLYSLWEALASLFSLLCKLTLNLILKRMGALRPHFCDVCPYCCWYHHRCYCKRCTGLAWLWWPALIYLDIILQHWPCELAPKSWGKKEVVLEHNNKKISYVPGMTKEMMGRAADNLTSTL